MAERRDMPRSASTTEPRPAGPRLRVGIVGAGGLIGRHALEAALDANHQVVALHRGGAATRERLAPLGVVQRAIELGRTASLQPALEGLDAVIHAAAPYPTAPRPWRAEVAEGIARMHAFYDAAAEAGVRTVVYVGAAIAVPRRPDGAPADGGEHYAEPPRDPNPYLQLKLALDAQARAVAGNGRDIRLAVPGLVIGAPDPGPSTGRLVVGIARGALRRVVPGLHNVVDARDAGRGIVQVLDRGQPGTRYLLTGANTDMLTLAGRIAALSGRAPPRPVPLAAAKVAALLQRGLHAIGGPRPSLDATALALMGDSQWLDGAVAARELGYAPRFTLDDTLGHALAWFRSVGLC